MYRRFAIIMGLIIGLVGCSESNLTPSRIKKADPLRVASFNIRNSAADDKENSWEHRKDLVAQTILNQKMELIGLQEVLDDQLQYLSSSLKNYQWCGVAREDGKSMGEYAPVFFDASRFQLLSDSTLWLSETPDIPGSMAWGTACTRIVTWAHLLDRKSDIEFWFFNTHFDHESELARNESAKLILNLIRDIAEEQPVILTGDFNMVEGDGAYQTLVHHWKGLVRLYDAGKLAVELEGPDYTFQAFDDQSDLKAKIDFVFVNDCFKASKQEVIPERKGDLYVSDHYPLVADLAFRMPGAKEYTTDSLSQTVYAPFLKKGNSLFADSTLVELGCWTKGARIRYTLDGTEPNEKSLQYQAPISVQQTATLTAKAFKDGSEPSRVVSWNFIHAFVRSQGEAYPKMKMQTPWNEKYSAGGETGLLDGIRGSAHYNDHKWKGYKGGDVEMVVDLGENISLKSVALGCLQSQGSWIFLPREVEFLGSSDNLHYQLVKRCQFNSDLKDEDIKVVDAVAALEGKEFRYLKVQVKNAGKCPSWHSGAGEDAWLFLDELMLERNK